MSTENVRVILLRRDEADLQAEEIAALKEKFPGKTIEFRRTDPRDYQEHAAQCEELKPVAVLPPPAPHLFSLAMERGFPHIVLTCSGLMEFQGPPPLKPFEPKVT